MGKRINRCIELLEQDVAIYYDGPHSGHVLTYEQGRTDAARAALHGPGFVLGTGIAIVLALAVWTHGFRGSPDHQQLISLTRPHYLHPSLVQHYTVVIDTEVSAP